MIRQHLTRALTWLAADVITITVEPNLDDLVESRDPEIRARIKHAVYLVDQALTAQRTAREWEDVVLDIRSALRPAAPAPADLRETVPAPYPFPVVPGNVHHTEQAAS